MSSPVFGVHAGAVRGRARNRRRSGRTRTEALLVRFHPAIRHESCDRCHLSCVLRSHRIRHVVDVEPVGQRRYECNQPRRVCRNWHYRRDWHCVRAAAGIAQLAVGQPAIEVFGGLGCSAPLPALIIVALMARYLWLSPYGCPEDCSLSDSSGDCCLPGAALGLMPRLCGAKAYSMTRPSPRMRRTTLSARRHQPPTPSQTSYANSLPSVDSLWKKSPGTRPQCPTTRRHTTNHPRPGYSASLSAGHGG